MFSVFVKSKVFTKHYSSQWTKSNFSLKLSYCCGATDNAIGVSLEARTEKFSLFSKSAKGVCAPHGERQRASQGSPDGERQAACRGAPERNRLKVTRLGLDWLWSRVRWHCSYYSWRRTRIVGRGPKTEIACSLRRFEWRIRTRADPGSNRLARAAQCVGKRVCPINATVDSYWRSSSSPTTARAPHQFRTRNGLAKTQRTRSISDENAINQRN